MTNREKFDILPDHYIATGSYKCNIFTVTQVYIGFYWTKNNGGIPALLYCY